MLVARVRAEYHAVHGVVFALLSAKFEKINKILKLLFLNDELLDVGQPLHGERRPLERVRHDKIIEEGRVLLPCFIFVVDARLLRGLDIGLRHFVDAYLSYF